jgi:hypothetical protein
MKFRCSCEWLKESCVLSIEDIFPDFYDGSDKTKAIENLEWAYGRDVYKDCLNAKIGEIINWEEPFNGWVRSERIE